MTTLTQYKTNNTEVGTKDTLFLLIAAERVLAKHVAPRYYASLLANETLASLVNNNEYAAYYSSADTFELDETEVQAIAEQLLQMYEEMRARLNASPPWQTSQK